LAATGVDPEKLEVICGGADPHLFKPHVRQTGALGFSTAFYPRKNPDCIFQIVEQLPEVRFYLFAPTPGRHGDHRRWVHYERFSELMTLPNLTYIEAPYPEIARCYQKIDVFCSVSKLEGGPIPLVEAMRSNCVPVVSRTGFAEDLICHGQNGYLFPVDASVEAICSLIKKALAFEGEIHPTVEHLTWEKYAKKIYSWI